MSLQSRHDRAWYAEMEAALRSTAGCVLVRRRCGVGAELRDSEQAEAWAKTQPFYSRIVHRGRSREFWCWWVRPEVAK
jgi:hypothetical protein